MRRYVLAAVVVLVGGLAAPARANESAMQVIGGAAMPMKSHPGIVMKSERVLVRLTQEEAEVDCTFVFRNTGDATRVLMGFPERGWGDVSLDSEDERFRDFRAFVDGSPVAVKEVVERDDEDGFQVWWTKEVAFAAGQTRTVRNTYRTGLSISAGRGGAAGLAYSFSYVLSTGASWKGRIGSVEVTVELIGLGEVEDVNLHPGGYTRGPRQVTWRWRNLEATENHDIGISFGHGGNALLYVDGEWSEFAGGDGPFWGPRLEGERVFALAAMLAHWVGASLSWDSQSKTATLERQGKRLAVTVGKQTAQADGRALPLGGTPRLTVKGNLEVPVQPVAEAFGAVVRFDPVTEGTYLHTPKALAATRPPEWLSRRLTEGVLRWKRAEELRAMRNEIYARRGRQFQNREVRDHFYCQPWYEPNPKYSDALLSEVDRANLAVLRKVEAMMGRRSGP